MQKTPDEYDELLDCRLAMLGLNLDATNSDTFNEIVRRCTSCSYREACAVDVGNLLSKRGRIYCACGGATYP
jgi:hypothetical protein